MGARVDASPGGLDVRRGRWPLRAIRLDCNHMPDAAMTLAALALYRRRPVAPRQHRQLAGQGDRPARGDGLRAAQGRRRRRRGRRLHRDHAAAGVASGIDRHLRRPPDGDGDGARGLQRPGRRRAPACRCASSTRAASPRPGPTISRPCSRSHRRRAPPIPVLTIDGPTASGKGTLASAVARELGYRLLDSGALYRAAALAALEAGTDPDDEEALAALAAASISTLSPSASSSPAAT